MSDRKMSALIFIISTPYLWLLGINCSLAAALVLQPPHTPQEAAARADGISAPRWPWLGWRSPRWNLWIQQGLRSRLDIDTSHWVTSLQPVCIEAQCVQTLTIHKPNMEDQVSLAVCVKHRIVDKWVPVLWPTQCAADSDKKLKLI